MASSEQDPGEHAVAGGGVVGEHRCGPTARRRARGRAARARRARCGRRPASRRARCRSGSSARRRPEVRHHRDDDRVAAQQPAVVRGRCAATTMIWSPSTRSPCSSTAITRSASPSNASPSVGAATRAPRRCSSDGVGRAARGVDVGAVGRGVQHVDLGAQRRAAPRDRLRTRRRSRSRSRRAGRRATALERADAGARRSRRTRCGARWRCRRPRPRRPIRASRWRGARSSSSIAASRCSASLRPPAPNSFIAVVAPTALWLAEIDRGGRAGSRREERDPGRGEHAERATRRRPRRTSPATSAASSIGPGAARVAADDERVSAPSTRAAARPERDDQLDGELGVRVAAHAVGAEPQSHRDALAQRR